MPSAKVLPSRGPSGALLSGPGLTATQHRVWTRVLQRLQRALQRLLEPYARLSWTARHTLDVGVNLYVVLYLFLTVPFRIGYYYDPFGGSHGWEKELQVFAVADGVADVVGMVQCIRFYRMWKGSVLLFVSSIKSEVPDETDEPIGNNVNALVHSASYRNRRRGKAKWTIATIAASVATTETVAQKIVSQQKFMRARTLEMVLEVVAVLPIEIIPYALGRFNTLHLVRLTKLCRLYRLRRSLLRVAKIYADRTWMQRLSSTGVDTLVRNVGICAGLCHWVACGYMLIAHLQCGISLHFCDENVETSWVVRDRLFGASVLRKYSRTLYWATRTLVLLGYDDVTPVSNAETLYAILVTLMGALFGSSLLANFLFLFRFRNARYAAYSTHVDNAREYMRLKNIPRPLRHQVIAYFNYSWSTHHSLDSEEALHLMPKHLQSKVVSTLKASRIKQVCFLMKESVEFINSLALALSRRVYSPGDQVIEPKTSAEMFFVIRGKVVLCGFDGSNAKECTAGDFFADSCLLFPDQYEVKVFAKTFCELYVLAKAKFDDTLSEFYRGQEASVRFRMAETLEKYSMQLAKMKKLLGLRGSHENSSKKSSLGGSSHSLVAEDTNLRKSQRGVSWRFPDSSFCAHWDTARLLGIIHVAIEVPYFAVFIAMSDGKHLFAVQPEIGLRYVVTLLVEVFFGVDLILRSRYFTYIDSNMMLNIVQSNLIFENYKKHGFFVDLLAWLPLGLVLDSLPSNPIQGYSSIFRLLRLLRIRLAPSLLQDIFEFYGKSSKLRLVISLIMVVTLMLHVVGCLWFEMTVGGKFDGYSTAMEDLTRSSCLQQATLFQNCSWVKYDCYAHIGTVFPHDDTEGKHVSTYSASFAYLRSVYWAIATLTAVGYGDIVAYSTAESYFAALWIFLGGIINFGVVGAMSSTISNVLATHHHHIEKINTLNAILERMDISEGLSTDIRRFYHNQYAGRKEAYESELLSYLPDELCYRISSLLHSEDVSCVPLFDSASIEFIKEVTGKFRHKSYQNGETISLEGDVCRAFFVLLHGSKVNVFFRSRKVPVRALCGGDCYGVNEFLLRRPYPATLIAASLVHASVMSREQFDVIQRKFTGDVNDMKQEAEVLIAEEHNLLGRIGTNLEKIKLQSHMIQTPTLFYQRDSAIVLTNKKQRTLSDAFSQRGIITSLWSINISCWGIYNALFVVFRVCFHSHLHFSSSIDRAVLIVDVCCDVCFALDIYLRLYYLISAEVTVENLISRQVTNTLYLHSSKFRRDLLASLPIYTPFSSASLVASLCRLPRLLRCVDLWMYLDDAIVMIQQQFATRNVSAYLSPVKLMIILVLVAHYVGCIFFLISEHECEHTEKCWMRDDHLLHEYHHTVYILYAKTFYWAVTTLLLVGSSEIVPRDTVGTLWTGFTCLCCTFIIGHIVGEISELILELGKETKQYKSRIASFESFAKEHNISATLRERVVFFFKVEFEHTKGLDTHSTVHDLSANLRLKLMLEMYGHSIHNLPICRFLTSSQINNLTLRMKSELYVPGDNIIVEGTFGSRLCTLRKGLAATYWSKSVSSISLIMEGAFFGEIAFFLPNQRRLATVRATTFCEVLFVSKNDWQELWVASGNAADDQVQKHALHAILGWVSSRLQRYQRAGLRTANKAKQLLSLRARIKSISSTNESSASLETKTMTKLLANLIKSKEPHGITRASTPPRKSSRQEVRRLFVSPQAQLLEKKAEYVIMKTDAYSTRFGADIAFMQTRRASIFDSIRSSIRTSLSSRHSASRARESSQGALWHSSNLDGSMFSHDSGKHKSDNIRLMQFMIDLNPANKHVREALGKHGLQALEEECWTRCRMLAEARHTISKLLGILLPPEAGITIAPRQSHLRSSLGSKRLRRQRSWVRPKKKRKQKADALDVASNTAAKVSGQILDARPGDSKELSQRRRLSVHTGPSEPQQRASAAKTDLVATLVRLTRCNSVPSIDQEFLSAAPRSELPRHSRRSGPGIDFEVLQRCQRPQYATQLHWYHRYLQWKTKSLSAVVPDNSVVPEPVGERNVQTKRGHAFSLTGDIQVPGFRRIGRPRVAAMGSKLQLPSQRTLLSSTTDLNTKQFIQRIKEVGKAWDMMMLVIAIYHVIVTPLKICFAPALIEVQLESLRSWSAFEIFLDILSLIDVTYQIRHALMMYNKMAIVTSQSGGTLLKTLLSDLDLLGNICAILPLELLLLATPVRLTVLHIPSHVDPSDAAWWATRWLLRSNRMLLTRRIIPLSEELFMYFIHDLKVSAKEEVLYFMRGLASYLTTGHLLACLWFLTSDLGYYYFGNSWLSTSGMLTYIPPESTGSFMLESVSLSRKYLRSLLFSMECISTLFYGDILSMNPLELVAEIAITFWSIYIYGALVGAQAELLDSQARQEAAFEQSLGEIQRYVVQNGVPKNLKQHIKAYYARLWRRTRGEKEFTAVSSISRVLYEDVVLTSLRHFAIQVKAFRALDEYFLRGLLVCLEYIVCSEGEEVVAKGDVDRSMYFIAQGRILVRIDTSEVTRERGEHFGELTLLYGISRLETCVALSVAELYRLDHEPYERLLTEFPEYRVRNKIAWTTLSTEQVESQLRLASEIPQHPRTSLASRPSLTRIAAVNAFNIEARLPFSFVHKSSMTMLARLQALRPHEAKELIIKCREGARKHLMRCVAQDEEEQSQHSDGSGAQARLVGLPKPDIKLLRVLEKTRALHGQH